MLLVRKNREQARKDLVQLRHKEDVDAEMDDIAMEATHASKNASCDEMLRYFAKVPTSKSLFTFRYPLVWPLIVATMMLTSNMLCGENAVRLLHTKPSQSPSFQVMFYSTAIFKMAIASEEQAQYWTIGIGVLCITMSITSMFLVDRLGRRLLHLGGMAGMAITTALITLFLQLEVSSCIDFVSGKRTLADGHGKRYYTVFLSSTLRCRSG